MLPPNHRFRRRSRGALVSGLALVFCVGCVERSITVESVPSGAQVVLDGIRAGTTPVTIPFTHYGGREIALRKSGYQPGGALEVLQPPFYQQPPYDLYYELNTDIHFQDQRRFSYTLDPVPQSETTRESVEAPLQRGSQLRQRR